MLNLKPERLDSGEFNEQPLSICGKSFIADFSGGLYWPAEQALIVADLQLVAGLPGAAGNDVAQPYAPREKLNKLAEVIDRTRALTVICLAGSVRDWAAGARMAADDRDTLRMLQDDREWIWISGFNNRAIEHELGGHVRSELTVEGLTLRPSPCAAAVTHEIAGHLRPAAKISRHGHSIRRPCFVGNGRRLVLPAFGAVTGGLNVLDGAFAPLFANGGQSVWMLGQEGLYPVASRLLRED